MISTIAHNTISVQWLKKLLTLVLLVACVLRLSGFDNGYEKEFIAKGHQKSFATHKITAHSLLSDCITDDEEGNNDEEIVVPHWAFFHYTLYSNAFLKIATLKPKLFSKIVYVSASHIPLFLRNRNIRI